LFPEVFTSLILNLYFVILILLYLESGVKEEATGTCNAAPSTDLVVDDVKTEDVVAQIIEKRETRRQKLARTKQPKDVGALFQKYRDGGEKDAIVYLNQLTKTLKCNEPTLEPSGSYRASLKCDGEVRKLW